MDGSSKRRTAISRLVRDMSWTWADVVRVGLTLVLLFGATVVGIALLPSDSPVADATTDYNDLQIHITPQDGSTAGVLDGIWLARTPDGGTKFQIPADDAASIAITLRVPGKLWGSVASCGHGLKCTPLADGIYKTVAASAVGGKQSDGSFYSDVVFAIPRYHGAGFGLKVSRGQGYASAAVPCVTVTGASAESVQLEYPLDNEPLYSWDSQGWLVTQSSDVTPKSALPNGSDYGGWSVLELGVTNGTNFYETETCQFNSATGDSGSAIAGSYAPRLDTESKQGFLGGIAFGVAGAALFALVAEIRPRKRD